MKKEEPSVKDICRLIVACKENGVSELKIGTLHLFFGNAPARAVEKITPEAAIPPEDLKAQDQENEIAAAQSKDEDEVSLMVIEDPVELERRIASGEMIDEITEH